MNKYCKLAKNTVEKYLKEGKILALPKNLPKEFAKKAGVFVTILNQGKLRGCIGTYSATEPNIAKEIIKNAISAATRDWRFRPISKEELAQLSYEISILEKPKLVKDIEKLNPKKFGIIVRSLDSEKSALLLPNLKGLDTTEKQIAACCKKASIETSREKIVIYRFKTKKYV